VDLGRGEPSAGAGLGAAILRSLAVGAPEMVEKFQFELEPVLAFFNFPAPWRHRLRTTNLGEGWFKHLRRYLSRFPGCRNAQHSEQVLGCFLLAAESMHR
jgi:transposase-like protein